MTRVPVAFNRPPAFGYPAFGLYLRSDTAVPGLIEAANPGFPEIRVSMGVGPADFEPADYLHTWYESRYKAQSGQPFLTILTTAAPEGGPPSFWMKYADGTNVFFGENLGSISVTWSSSSSCIEDAATYLLGPAMAVFAQLRGTTCLHGSAVIVDGVAIALLGPQGAGKSTSAAAFARAGYPVVTDDLILLIESPDGFLVEPTYPVVRLWPASVEYLFGDENALPRLIPNWEKRGLHLDDGEHWFQRESRPLAALYLLGERSGEESAPYLSPISGAGALLKLISNSWGHYADKPEILAAQMQVFTRLSQRVPIRRLVAHKDSARLPQLCQLLIDDIRSIAGTGVIAGGTDREQLARAGFTRATERGADG